jgi:hypothetical protein
LNDVPCVVVAPVHVVVAFTALEELDVLRDRQTSAAILGVRDAPHSGSAVRARWLAPLLAMALFAAGGCAPTQPATTGAPSGVPTPSSRPSLTTPPSLASSTELVAGPFALAIPSAWHVRKVLPNPSGNWTLDFLGPAAIPSECTLLANGVTECRPWPVVRLNAGGIVVAVRQYGMPGSKPPGGGEASIVAGQAARTFQGPADKACRAIGGTSSTAVVLPAVPGSEGWFSFEACAAGPGTAAADAAFMAIVNSATLAVPGSAPSQ